MNTNNLKFLKSHEWVRLEQDNIAYVGISDHAQGLLGDIVYLELPKIGDKIKKDGTIGVIESVKAASDLYSPVSGEVIATNEDAINNPSIVNTNPYDNGWLIKVKLSDSSELDSLMSADDYEQSL
ncbi:MAG: glycine cleavage system protein GcvH [Neisseriaceae bacterium]|jgi:glycine cleavage system H protein